MFLWLVLTRINYNFIKRVGRGGYGNVWKVERKKDSKVFAAKEMFKAIILSKKSVNSILNELRILKKFKDKLIK